MRTMRIAYVNATLRRTQDGVTRVLYRAIEEGLARNWKVMAIGATLPAVEDQLVPMAKVPAIPFPLQPSYPLALPGAWFTSQLAGFDPDLIHLQSPCLLGIQALNFATRRGIPVVATYHTHFPSYLPYYHLRWAEPMLWHLLRSFYSRAYCTFIPTHSRLQELKQQGFSNLEYLPNGVDLEEFSPTYRSAAWRTRLGVTEQPVVLFVSRLVWEKNLRVLQGMYHRLRAAQRPFRMVVVGDGPARESLEAMMPGAVFLGHQVGRELATIFASADIFVFPSTTETFGNVVLEALASGLVAVTARATASAEIIEEGRSGLLASPHASDFAAKVEWLFDHRDWWPVLARGARQRAQQFSWDEVLDQLFARYVEVVEVSKSKRMGNPYKDLAGKTTPDHNSHV